MWTLTNRWVLDFPHDLGIAGYLLPNGIRIPFPAFGSKWWPRKDKTVEIGRMSDGHGRVYYQVTVMPKGDHLKHQAERFAFHTAVGRLLSMGFWKPFVGGLAGRFAAGASSLLMPTNIATERLWNLDCSEGPVYGATLGF